MLSSRVRLTMLILVSGTLPALHALAEQPSTDSTVDSSVLRAALGQCAGDPGFDPRADLNEDGCVNVLDVAILRKRAGELKASDDLEPSDVGESGRRTASGGGCTTEEIFVREGAITVQAGLCGKARLLLRCNSTPLLGYSLDVDISPVGGAAGSVTADVALTNFYIVKNLIEANPSADLDPLFSLILDPGDGGVFVNAITADVTTPVTAAPGMDVLAEVFFDASANADGDFTIQLGPATALSDANADAVAYDFATRTIKVGGCLADFDLDGEVRVPDLVILLASWGACECCVTDLDGNGEVRVPDLIIVLGAWGNCLP